MYGHLQVVIINLFFQQESHVRFLYICVDICQWSLTLYFTAEILYEVSVIVRGHMHVVIHTLFFQQKSQFRFLCTCVDICQWSSPRSSFSRKPYPRFTCSCILWLLLVCMHKHPLTSTRSSFRRNCILGVCVRSWISASDQ